MYGLPNQSREKLDSYIADFNEMFGTKYSTKSNEDFYNYYNEVSRKVKNKQVDLLLVVNMFLTGFDSPSLNTMYVDKNLQYHGLIQAYSRTNRILDEKKSQGNIVVFRNLKHKTDEAITLFSNKEAVDVIIMQPYENYIKIFDTKLEKLKEIAPNIDSVNDFITEEEELAFVQAFRELIRVKNVLNSFADFNWEDLQMTEQDFENYKSKYLDLWHKVKTDTQKEKVSILDDVDFELELIHQDDINVTYIIKKLIELKLSSGKSEASIREEILQSLQTNVTLRSKKELIENFILNNLPVILDSEDIEEEFNNFIKKEREKEFNTIISEENLNPEKTQNLIENYLFAEREPLNDEILELLATGKPSILQRRPLGERILKRLNTYIETFINGIN